MACMPWCVGKTISIRICAPFLFYIFGFVIGFVFVYVCAPDDVVHDLGLFLGADWGYFEGARPSNVEDKYLYSTHKHCHGCLYI